VVAKTPEGQPVVRRLNFARQIFGERSFDPTYTEYVTALRARGFNVFQAASLAPLEVTRSRVEGRAPDPAQALSAPTPWVPQRFKQDPAMRLADQLVSAMAEVRAYLPANALNAVPRVLNSYEDACQAVAMVRRIIASYHPGAAAGALEQRLLRHLVNPYGVDWLSPGLAELNVQTYGQQAAGMRPSFAARIRQAPRYTVTSGARGEAEKIRDRAGNTYHFSLWRDNLKAGDHRQRLKVGLVSPSNPGALHRPLAEHLR
jgi:hypothetical protein